MVLVILCGDNIVVVAAFNLALAVLCFWIGAGVVCSKGSLLLDETNKTLQLQDPLREKREKK